MLKKLFLVVTLSATVFLNPAVMITNASADDYLTCFDNEALYVTRFKVVDFNGGTWKPEAIPYNKTVCHTIDRSKSRVKVIVDYEYLPGAWKNLCTTTVCIDDYGTCPTDGIILKDGNDRVGSTRTARS